MSNTVRDWVTFWDQPHSIYVNARHFDVHYRDIAEGVVALLPGPDARVLDFGCGEALHAGHVAAHCRQLLLCESAARVRMNLEQRFAANANIQVLSPEDVERMPEASLDLIVANSVVQYLSRDELERLLKLWRRLLAPGRTLVVGDVIPPNVSAVSDVAALLRYAAKHGFLGAALFGLLRTAVSPYRKLRAQLGIACYTEQEFLALLSAAGFRPERLPVNLEHNPSRMTFRAERLD